MFQNYGDTKLFSKVIPVTVKDGISQCRNAKLYLTVEWKEKSSALQRKELMITLTDSNDPFFLYHVYLSEDDFQRLKSSQGLLVDFSAFPQKFVDLLELCIADENNVHPKFLLIFNASNSASNLITDSQLDVVETNPFKHLVHLSLKFSIATDSAIKQYLVVCFKTLKDEKQELGQRLSSVEQDLRQRKTSYEEVIQKKTLELESVRRELSVELSMKESTHSRELQVEREKYLTKQREEEERFEREKKEKDYNFKKEIQNLETRVNCLESLNKDLQDKVQQRDSTIRDLKARTAFLESDLQKSLESLKEAQRQTEAAKTECRDRRQANHKQKEKVEDLEKEVSTMSHQVSQLKEQCDMHLQKEKSLESEIGGLKLHFNKAIKNKAQLEADISKANSVIEKLRSELQTVYEKSKQKGLLLEKNLREGVEKNEHLKALRKDLKQLELKLNSKTDQVKSLTQTIDDLQKKLSDTEKELKAQENVRKYLHRQLTDRLIMPNYTSSTSPATVPFSLQHTTEVNDNNAVKEIHKISPASYQSSAIPTRYPNHLSPQNGNKVPVSQNPPDSAYLSSPSLPLNDGGNNGPLEIDPSALSAAFGSGLKLRHSTAKKQSGAVKNKTTLGKKR